MTVSSVTATPVPSGNPTPHIRVEVSGIVGQRITVYRSMSGQVSVVRGAYKQPTLGSAMEFWDWEAPFGVPVSYRAEVVDGSSTAMAQSGSATLDVSAVWISDPLSPRVSLAVELEGPSAQQVDYDRAEEVLPVTGSSLPIAVSGISGDGAGMAISFRAYTVGQRLSILAVLRSPGPTLLRCPSIAGKPIYSMLPSLAYLSTPKWTATDVDQAFGGGGSRVSSTAVTLVRPPMSPVAVAPRTYQDALNEADTYTAGLILYPTYAAARRGGA